MSDRSKVMTQTKRYPGPPGYGFKVGLTTPPSKKLIVMEVEQRRKPDRLNGFFLQQAKAHSGL